MSNCKEHFDVIVVGGGIIGMLTARQLQCHGLSVAIFDKARLGGAATWAAGGILASLNPSQQNTIAQKLILEGIVLIEENKSALQIYDRLQAHMRRNRNMI